MYVFVKYPNNKVCSEQSHKQKNKRVVKTDNGFYLIEFDRFLIKQGSLKKRINNSVDMIIQSHQMSFGENVWKNHK